MAHGPRDGPALAQHPSAPLMPVTSQHQPPACGRTAPGSRRCLPDPLLAPALSGLSGYPVPHFGVISSAEADSVCSCCACPSAPCTHHPVHPPLCAPTASCTHCPMHPPPCVPTPLCTHCPVHPLLCALTTVHPPPRAPTTLCIHCSVDTQCPTYSPPCAPTALCTHHPSHCPAVSPELGAG